MYISYLLGSIRYRVEKTQESNLSEEHDIKPRRRLDISSLIIVIITNFVTLSGSLFAFKTSQDTTQSALMKTALHQVQLQSKEIVELRGLLLDAQIKIINLETRVRSNVDETVLMSEFLDSLPFPAWIKRFRKEDGLFEMTLINQHYTADFGYTENEYIGKTDFDIHSDELASLYLSDDLMVLSTEKMRVIEQIMVTKNGVPKKIFVYKFIIRLPDGELAVGGVAIDKKDIGVIH
jgi:hypothetical protein